MTQATTTDLQPNLGMGLPTARRFPDPSMPAALPVGGAPWNMCTLWRGQSIRPTKINVDTWILDDWMYFLGGRLSL